MAFMPKGIIPPIITPLNEDGGIRYDTLKKLIDHLIDSGVHGIFPFGTTGEFYAFEFDPYRRALDAAREAIAGRVPFIAGANHITTQGVIDRVKVCEEAGADAVSVLTPVFISQTQDELYDYFRRIAESTALPVLLYNNPPKTNINIAPETVARLAEIPNIAAIKDTSGDMTNLMEYIRLTQGIDSFSVLAGKDTMIYPALCCGASGAIATCANIAPRLVVDIYEKYIAGDNAGAIEAQFALTPLRMAVALGSFPQAVKEGLTMMGIDCGNCVPPIAPLTDAQRGQLHSALNRLGLIEN